MPFEVKIPSVGESITSGVLGNWSKKEGDYVASGEVILEVETDKVTFEVYAGSAGLLKPLVPSGSTVEVGQVVALIEESEIPASTGDPSQTPSAEASSPQRKASADVELSPAVRALVLEHKLDPSLIPATGKAGRLTKEDVLNFLASSTAPKADSAPVVTPSLSPVAQPQPEARRVTRKTMTQLRRKIADRLVTAQQESAILTTFNEADMSQVLAVRSKFQDRFQAQHSIKIGFMSFFVQAVVHALKSVPEINARIDGDDIVQNHFYDVGVAISTEKGLLVPVLRQADQLSLADLEKAIAGFAAKARAGKITLDDLEGGVFTITNGGIFGSLLSTPILNPPQSGILGMHAIQERPVAVQGRVEIRPMMYLALSYDHRIVDGKQAVTFLVRVKEFIENPAVALLGI